MKSYQTIESLIGNTPLVRLQHLSGETSNTLLVKLEGDNPAGSVKDRAALSMINLAEQRGDIKAGDTLIEATSGNTGIALAMSAAIRGYNMILLMPDTLSHERRASMKAYGAELILVSKEQGGMEGARDIAEKMQADGKGYLLDQFSNPDNYQAHIDTTGPEIWRDTNGEVTHFVSAMGTTGTITGVGIYLKQQNPNVQIVGVEPLGDDDDIPGIRRWTADYVPAIFAQAKVDQTIDMTQKEAEDTMRALATEEGIFCGVSAGGAVAAALQLSQTVENATIVTIIPDRGDRYISTGVFPA
ncbi:MAG TPA: cysteine synthase CysM [Leucothrix mucor]|uniref:Cysteine synthase n=1 Tax=Leucothrix mucor TaxID=45248 RepID=A0A7V2WUY8_LEUMU|nr:cysteine synthase CysM [Leucothrix mucor]